MYNQNEFGDVLRISSSDSNIKGILENLFYEILNVEFNLWGGLVICVNTEISILI